MELRIGSEEGLLTTTLQMGICKAWNEAGHKGRYLYEEELSLLRSAEAADGEAEIKSP